MGVYNNYLVPLIRHLSSKIEVLTVEVQPDILIGLYIFTLIRKTNAKVDYL